MQQTPQTAQPPPPEITIVITCYNEEPYILDTIENVVGALQEAGRSYEIIVVDDVSKDNSVLRVRQYIEQHPDLPIHLHINTQNRGLANNYVDAAFLGHGKYYRLCCGDNSEPKEALVHIFRHLGEADIIIPYQKQNEVVGKSRTRKGLSRVFTFLVNRLSGYKIHYYNGGAVHLRYNVMRWHPNTRGFGFQADIITRLLDEGASYAQVPSFGIDRKGSKSTAMNVRNLLSVAHSLLEIGFRRVNRMLYARNIKRPIEIDLQRGKPAGTL